jgi:hypothetical protein
MSSVLFVVGYIVIGFVLGVAYALVEPQYDEIDGVVVLFWVAGWPAGLVAVAVFGVLFVAVKASAWVVLTIARKLEERRRIR